METQQVAGHPYQEVAAAIVAKIKSGRLEKDARLPSVRALARESDVSAMTAQKALNHLADVGYARVVPGLGYFVSEPPEETDVPTLETINRQLDDLQAAVADLSQRLERLEGARDEK